MKESISPYHFYHPKPADGGKLWELVRNTPALDLNSAYYYIYFGHAFSQTSLIAKEGESIAGFITGLCPPETPDRLFIWQVCVSRACQGKGLGLSMLDTLTRKVQPRWVEATVTPSNGASIALFTALARRYEVPWTFQEEIFPASCFGAAAHEAEILFSIGPMLSY